MRRSAIVSPRARVLSIVGELNRADMAVLALGFLGAGSLWALRGRGNAFEDSHPATFLIGFAMVAAAGMLCLFAIGRSSAMPSPIICAVAIAVQVLPVPGYVLPFH